MNLVNSCGIIPIKGGIRTTSTGNYLAGSRMTVTCESSYTFYGWPDYICNNNGTWLPTNNVPLSKFRAWPVCERNLKKLVKSTYFMNILSFHFSFYLDRHITAIKWSSVGISCLVVLLFIAALVYYLVFQRNKNTSNRYFLHSNNFL